MAKAKKLKSGSWNVKVYDYTDEHGKIHLRSFTSKDPSPAGRREVEFMAAEFMANKEHRDQVQDITVQEAVDRYIRAKEGVLAPGTVKGYRAILKQHLGPICNLSVRRITNADIQRWVSDISVGRSPKTVRNIHALLSSALTMFAPDFQIRDTLPQKVKPELHMPTDTEIRQLLEHAQGRELEAAILLAAFGPLRRGEICALEANDIQGTRVTVSKSMAVDATGGWIIKTPKTYESYRDVDFPDFVIKRLWEVCPSEGRLIRATPDQITSRFRRAVKACGLPHFRFHDLRHYACSIMHAIGIPDQYIMSRGGWATDGVMKRIYRGTVSDQTAAINKKIFDHFQHVADED